MSQEKDLEPASPGASAREELEYTVVRQEYFYGKGQTIDQTPGWVRLTLDMDRRTWRKVRHFLLHSAEAAGPGLSPEPNNTGNTQVTGESNPQGPA